MESDFNLWDSRAFSDCEVNSRGPGYSSNRSGSADELARKNYTELLVLMCSLLCLSEVAEVDIDIDVIDVTTVTAVTGYSGLVDCSGVILIYVLSLVNGRHSRRAVVIAAV